MTPQQIFREVNSRIELAKQDESSELDLSSLRIEDYQLSIILRHIEKELPNIESLDLLNNDLTEIPEQIKKLKNLRSLNLSNNKIKSIPAEIGELKNLQELSLSINELTDLPSEIANLKDLIYLNIGQNNFNVFPPEISELKGLEYLILNDNFIIDIPDEIINLGNLSYLDLSRNELFEIPNVICDLQKLQYLDLSETNLHEINEKIVTLTNLVHLSLQKNQIEQLPSNMKDLRNLQTLDLHSNSVLEVPPSIDSIEKLQYLNLKNNPLSDDTMYYLINNLDKVEFDFDMAAHEEDSTYEEVLSLIYPGETDLIIERINALDTSWEFENGNGAVKKAKDGLAKIRSKEEEDPHGTKKVRLKRLIKHNTLSAKNVIIEFLKKIPVDNHKIDEVYAKGAKHIIDLVLSDDSDESTKKTELFQMAERLGNCSTAVRSFLAQTYIIIYQDVEPKPKDYESLLAREALESEIMSRFKNKTINKEKILTNTEQIEQVQGLLNAIFYKDAAEHKDNKCKIVFKDGEKPDTLTSKTGNIEFSFGIIKDELVKEFAKLCCETQTNGEPVITNEGKYVFSAKKLDTIINTYKSEYLISNSVKELVIMDLLEKAKTYIIENPDLVDHHFENPDVADFINQNKLKEVLRAKLLDVPESEAPKIADQFYKSHKCKLDEILKDPETEEMQIEYDKEAKRIIELGNSPKKSVKRPESAPKKVHGPTKKSKLKR